MTVDWNYTELIVNNDLPCNILTGRSSEKHKILRSSNVAKSYCTHWFILIIRDHAFFISKCSRNGWLSNLICQFLLHDFRLDHTFHNLFCYFAMKTKSSINHFKNLSAVLNHSKTTICSDTLFVLVNWLTTMNITYSKWSFPIYMYMY